MVRAKIGLSTRIDSICVLMDNVSTDRSPTQQCRSCRFNARSSYLVCAVHPSGPKLRQCLDFESLKPLAQSPSGRSPQALAIEPDWMRFWGPPENEWLAVWGAEELGEVD